MAVGANQQQAEAWNGGESGHFVDHADRYDRQFAPFSDLLLDSVQAGPDHVVLDVGCGCGTLTLAAATAARSALGADISQPLLRVATDRARAVGADNVDFVVADAQTHDFTEGAFDLVISQFGMMFFDDPTTAFANIRRAMTPGARVAFVCWQGIEANEWVSLVHDAVAGHTTLPDLGGQAGGPGMFALEHPAETTGLLEFAGFGDVAVEPVSPSILVGGGGTLAESTDFLLGMGIARGLLAHLDPGARAAAVERVRATLAERYEPGIGVRLGTGAWLVSARN